MSSKINVGYIIYGHFNTLQKADGETSLTDKVVFYFIPIFFGVLIYLLSFNLNKDVASMLITFGAIFTALLLSVLVLVYDQESKLDNADNSALTKDKKRLLTELYYNICYAILAALALVLFSFIHTALGDFKLFDVPVGMKVIAPIVIAGAVNLFLTILMIVKRMHTLLITV